VKYSYFDDGTEVAWVRFNGRDSTKSTWFADAKILDSMYTDLTSGATVTCAIAGLILYLFEVNVSFFHLN